MIASSEEKKERSRFYMRSQVRGFYGTDLARGSNFT
jgi:hypothetical protein